MELQNRGIRVEVAFLLGIGEGQKCVKKWICSFLPEKSFEPFFSTLNK
jgi:hypothetical protein